MDTADDQERALRALATPDSRPGKVFRSTVNGWKICHVAALRRDPATKVGDNIVPGKLFVTLSCGDARVNMHEHEAINSMNMAELNWIYCLKFVAGRIVDDRILEETIA